MAEARSAPRLDQRALSRFSAPDRRASAAGQDALFPLPLTPFEHLFLMDDIPSHPIQFFCRLRFSGRLQQQPLQEALRIALERHPLLTAIVQETEGCRPRWLACPAPPSLQWLEQEPTPAFPPASHLDLRVRPGLHAAAVVGSNKSDLVLQFHHAACDAVGAGDFTTDLLTAYANALAGTNRYRLKPLEVNRLRDREVLPLAGWRLLRWGIRQARALPALWRLYRRKPAPLVPHRPNLDETAPPPAFPEACIHHFSRAESAALAAIAEGATLNGLLARDLFLAVGRSRQQDGLPADACLRLMLPINMRSPGDRRMPAANVVSTVFLDRCLSDGLDSAGLLRRINTLMDGIKHDNFGLAWLLALRLLQRVPRAFAKVRRSRRRCLYSMLLTNIGPVLAASPLPRDDRRLIVGDTLLEDVEFLPVTRPLQCLGIAVSTYAGRLSLGMHYDSRVVTADRAKELLDDYVGAIRASICSPAARSA